MPIATLPDIEEIRQRLADRDRAEAQASADTIEQACPQVRSLVNVAGNYVSYMQNPSNRIMLGIHELDAMMLGTGRGDLTFVYGQVQQGKTQVILNAVNHNHDKHILYVTPDEIAEDVLVKLVGIRHGVNRREFEEKVKAKDDQAVKLLHETATKHFPHLSVVDVTVSLKDIAGIRRKLEDIRQRELDVLFIDYLGTVAGFQDEGQAAKGVKSFCKLERLPVFVVQQSLKSQEYRGKLRGIHGMLFGGQNEATFLIECARRKDDEDLNQFQRQHHENTITLALQKNKRGKLAKVDCYFDGDTARIRPLRDEDLVADGAPTSNAATAVRAQQIVQRKS